MLFAAWPARAAASDPGASVRDAIVAAVRARVGAHADVQVDDLQVRAAGPIERVTAVPDPAGRAGLPMVFVLKAAPDEAAPGRSIRVGSASARVHVTTDHARAARFVARGTVIGDADVVVVRSELIDVPLKPVLDPAAVRGRRALRDLAAGEVIGPWSVTAPDAVERGQTVTAAVSIQSVRATMSVVALDAGRTGDVIRVLNPESGRRLRARVAAPGTVEVVYER